MEYEINYDDPQLWEHLGIIIQEFEKAALQSESRDGLLAVANGPLEAMDMALASSEKSLTDSQWGSVKDAKQSKSNNKKKSNAGNPTSKEEEDEFLDTRANFTFEAGMENPQAGDGDTDGKIPKPSIEVGFDISADADFRALFPDGEISEKIQEGLFDCLGNGARSGAGGKLGGGANGGPCSGRLQFKWQLQPVDLLGPIQNLLDDINAAVDTFSIQMDPFSTLEQLCSMGNELRWFCIPDLIAMLMSFKMLLRKYLSFQLEVSLDWTVVLAPILKAITSAIANLVSAITSVLVAPIECAMSAIATVAQLQAELNETLATAAAVGERAVDRVNQGAETVSSFFDGEPGAIYNPVDGERTDYSYTVASVEKRLKNPDKRRIGSGLRASAKPSKGDLEGVVTGVNYDTLVRLPDSIHSAEFLSAHWSEKMLAGLADARFWIKDLDRNMRNSLNNLNVLVSGGLGVSLGNLGLLLLVKDFIGLIVVIIGLINQHGKDIDFCQIVQDNPEQLRPFLQQSLGRAAYGLSFDSQTGPDVDDNLVAVYKGPDRVGSIITCANKREGTPQGELLAQWISELSGGIK